MSYQFIPWTKTGTGAAVAVPDTLSDAVPARVRLPVSLRVNDKHDAAINVRLFGPGDITGIDQRQVVRVEPRALTADFEPNYFPAVEFRRPDFPWMFTPATGDVRGRLRPWLCLVVVRVQEGVRLGTDRSRPLPVLTISPPAQPSVELPDLTDSWAWAHTQVVGQEQSAALTDLLKADTARTISRLLCPVRLRPGTRYYACVVPAFQSGCKTGLGMNPGPEDEKLVPAWRSGANAPPSIDLPVYFHWEFSTGAGGDFESLVRRLQGRPVPEGVGARDMQVAGLGFGLADLGVVSFEGALRSTKPPGELPDPQKLAQFTHTLRGILNATVPLGTNPEPVVGPPIYGRFQAATQKTPAPKAPPVWLGDLNVDPRHRAVAGLGAFVVQDQQEQLMASAWEQLAGVQSAMQAIRQAVLAREVGRSILTRHLQTLSEPQLLQVTTPVHARLRFTSDPEPLTAATSAATPTVVPTLEAKLRDSHLPAGVTTAAFRRTFRSGGPITRRMTAVMPTAPRSPMMTRLVQAMVGRPTSIIPIVIVRGFATTAQIAAQLDGLRASIGSGATSPSPEATQFLAAGEQLQTYLENTIPQTAIPRPIPPPLVDVKQVALARLDPEETVTLRLRATLTPLQTTPTPSAPAPAAADTGVMPYPQFPQPLYEALRDISQEFLLPGASNVPADTVTLVKTNAAFVEAFMIGINHEMSRELLWREYPTDQRGTYFTRFWDLAGGGTAGEQPQIAPIHNWNPASALGRTFMGDGFEGRLVLLIRGEVMRRYPGTVIYAVRADALGKPDAQELYPVFRGALEPDMVFLGFDLSEDLARGLGGQPGYYFVLQEQPAEPRFGLDIPDEFGANPATLTSWNDVTWGHVTADAAAFEHLTYVPLAGRLAGRKLESAEWGFNAAHMARITLQKRVGVAIHASELLPPKP